MKDDAAPRREDPPRGADAAGQRGDLPGLSQSDTSKDTTPGEIGLADELPAPAAEAAPARDAAVTATLEAATANQAADPNVQAAPAGPAPPPAVPVADTAGIPAGPASTTPVETVPSPETTAAPSLSPAAAQAAKGQAQASEGETVASSDANATDDTEKPEEADESDALGMTLEAIVASQTQAPAQPAAPASAAAAAAASATQANHVHLAPQPQTGVTAGSAPLEAMNAIGGKGKPAGPDQVVLPEHAKARTDDAKAEVPGAAGAEMSPGEPGASAKPGAAADQFAKTAFEPAAGAPQHAPTAAPANAAAPHGPQKPEGPVPVIAQVPMGSVPVEIGLKGMAGINRFEIRLDPADLGRIDVRLDIDKDGGVKAHLSVDKVETLMLLQRDARTLERAFEQAGLKPSDSGVELSLRDQQAQGQGRQEHGGDGRREGPRWAGPDGRPERGEAVVSEPISRRIWRGTVGVDVRI